MAVYIVNETFETFGTAYWNCPVAWQNLLCATWKTNQTCLAFLEKKGHIKTIQTHWLLYIVCTYYDTKRTRAQYGNQLFSTVSTCEQGINKHVQVVSKLTLKFGEK